MWMITNCRSRGRPEARAGTLARSSSGSGSITTSDIAMAQSAPLCPMILLLTEIHETYVDVGYEIDSFRLTMKLRFGEGGLNA